MRHLRSAVGKPGSESIRICGLGRKAKSVLATKFVQVTHCELKNVSLLQLTDILTFGLEGRHNEVFELVQAFVDSGATFALQHRLHNLQEATKQTH
jgi:hypothetical protein